MGQAARQGNGRHCENSAKKVGRRAPALTEIAYTQFILGAHAPVLNVDKE